MADPISVRLDGAARTALEMTAESMNLTLSDALRLGADLLAEMTDEQLADVMKCRACNGTGKRSLRRAGVSE